MGQAIVIISGGIDLSIGSLMSLVNVLAAKYMVTSLGDATTGAPAAPGTFRRAILVSLLLIVFGFLAGALTGLIIQVTRVADIIVTLAMLFVWAGAGARRAGGAGRRRAARATRTSSLSTPSSRRGCRRRS